MDFSVELTGLTACLFPLEIATEILVVGCLILRGLYGNLEHLQETFGNV